MQLRDATPDDVEFIAWVMLAASRSHLDRGIWEFMYDFDEAQTLDFLKRVATTETVHLCHHSLFVVAEVDSKPAAAMCGYVPETQGGEAFTSVMPELLAGMTLDDDFFGRVAACQAVFPDNEPGALVVENVATLPEFRRQGLVAALLEELFDRGRSRGFEKTQIGVFLGNEPARKAYLKAGYEYVDEKRSAEFEAGMGCPGIERFLRPL